MNGRLGILRKYIVKHLPKQPLLTPSRNCIFHFTGKIGDCLEAVIRQWLLPAPLSNPAMLEMFRDRDKQPLRNLVPWAGEFAGKYLTHAAQIYRITKDGNLKTHLDWFVKELISLQDADGYLGPWPYKYRLTGKSPNCFYNFPATDTPSHPLTWDAWGHYHIMLGLLVWHELGKDAAALKCAERIADLLCDKFLHTGKRLVDIGSDEMNLAPIHSLCLLYRITGKKDYLSLAEEIEKDFEAPPAGDYIRSALKGTPFHKTPKPRWESLHAIQGIAELYFITGDQKYRKAFEHIWWSIVKGDRHNNGGFSSFEQAQGNPYDPRAIETCCTVAWLAMSIDMLRITGSSIVADEIELSTLNSGLGWLSPSGRWVTYNTPMKGQRKASPVDATAFQARPGMPELNCCAVNGPRVLGMIGDWAVMADNESVTLNYYGPCRLDIPRDDNRITLEQVTEYPEEGSVKINLILNKAAQFKLMLRIPHWSRKTKVAVNGKPVKNIRPGEYLTLNYMWRKHNIIAVNLDMSLHYWVGRKQCRGKVSVFRGPVLLAFDPRCNDLDFVRLPELDAKNMHERKTNFSSWLKPWILREYNTADGKKIRLCDFASAGLAGTPYKSWLRVKNVQRTAFSNTNPLRSTRV